MKNTLSRFRVEKISEQGRENQDTLIIAERPVTLFLNDQEVVTLLATPENLKELAVGFMLSEGWLREDKPIGGIEVDAEGMVHVEVSYRNPLTEKLFLRRTITSGCGRGTIFYNVLDSLRVKALRSSRKVSRGRVSHLMQELNRHSVLYHKSGSVHGAALSDGQTIRLFYEDIGRHNAVDKVLGAAFLQGISIPGKLLMTSGRISSEILLKVAKQRIPFLFSYSGPTDLAVDMARKIGMTLIGYVRGGRMIVYSHGERVTR